MIKSTLVEILNKKSIIKPLPFIGEMFVAALLGSTVFVAGCSKKNNDIDLSAYVETIDKPDVLYNEALANLDAGRLGEASKKFAAIDQQHPYTEWARKALVMGAFTNYKKGDYDEAVNTAKRYIALYPTSSEAAYAYYIIGLSYFRQIPDITRDQKDTKRAIAAMEEVVDRYPNSEYVADAKTKIRFCREQLAGKEMQIGRYYQERKEFLSAIKRYRSVVEEYSNTNQIEEALYRLVETNYALGLTSEAQTAASVLGRNYPDSPWYRDAYKLLQRGGVSPHENKGSWISKAFSFSKKKATQ